MYSINIFPFFLSQSVSDWFKNDTVAEEFAKEFPTQIEKIYKSNDRGSRIIFVVRFSDSLVHYFSSNVIQNSEGAGILTDEAMIAFRQALQGDFRLLDSTCTATERELVKRKVNSDRRKDEK